MAPVKSDVIDGKEIGTGQCRKIGAGVCLLPGERETALAAEEGASVLIEEDAVPVLRLGGVVGVVIPVGRNILDHGSSVPF